MPKPPARPRLRWRPFKGFSSMAAVSARLRIPSGTGIWVHILGGGPMADDLWY